ncbi:hypothetical protein U1701_04500 [Sphingomonas sp. PB2P19]|uniref:hypothetical protein n=1 Tax=Sphingomonas rhamnosi TaxID=3096156 RepID=UPI002FCA1EC7
MTDSRGWPSLLGGTLPPAAGRTERARLREAARAESAQARAEAALARAEERAAQRQAQVEDRERARQERAVAETAVLGLRASQLGIDTGVKLTTGRRRRTGKEEKGTGRHEERDTSAYRTVVEPERIRAFAGRGVSVAGIAAAFGLSEAEVEAALDYRD